MRWAVSPGLSFALERKWGSFSSLQTFPFHQNEYDGSEDADDNDDGNAADDDDDNCND